MNCKVMGIVNVTPDSFSDGGKYFSPEEAVRRAKNLVADGVDIVDLGAESTRPDATPLDWTEEWARLEPVLSGVAALDLGKTVVSVDTYHPETAERALAKGAAIVNCVYVEPAREMIGVCIRAQAELVVPAQLEDARLSSVAHYLDPMIGFGTSREEDLALLKSIPVLAQRGRVLIGASRKRIVKKLTGVKVPGKDIAGNLALVLFAALNGASCVRVHDVAETLQALKVWKCLAG